jgi:hypothetical protein
MGANRIVPPLQNLRIPAGGFAIGEAEVRRQVPAITHYMASANCPLPKSATKCLRRGTHGLDATLRNFHSAASRKRQVLLAVHDIVGSNRLNDGKNRI